MTKPRTIDMHTHILAQETAALLSKESTDVTITPDADGANATLDVMGTVYRPFPRGGYDVEQRLRDMDEPYVDVHVLSAPPQTYLYSLEPARAVATSAIQKDTMAKTAPRTPDT